MKNQQNVQSGRSSWIGSFRENIGQPERGRPDKRIQQKVLKVLPIGVALQVDELVERLPEVKWNDVFHEVNILREKGKVGLKVCGWNVEIWSIPQNRRSLSTKD